MNPPDYNESHLRPWLEKYKALMDSLGLETEIITDPRFGHLRLLVGLPEGKKVNDLQMEGNDEHPESPR